MKFTMDQLVYQIIAYELNFKNGEFYGEGMISEYISFRIDKFDDAFF